MKSVYTGGEKVAEFESYDELRVGENNPAFIYEGNELVYPNPVKDGLVLWYDFSGRTNTDGQRGIAEDLSGNGNHGTLQNFNYTAESGYDKNKLLFDGVDDFLQVPETGLNPESMAVVDNGKIYSYQSDEVSVNNLGALVVEGRNLLKRENIISDSWVGSNGKLVYNSVSKATKELVPVSPGETIYLNRTEVPDDVTSLPNYWRYAWYDLDGIPIQRFSNSTAKIILQVPENAHGLLISWAKEAKYNLNKLRGSTVFTPAPEDYITTVYSPSHMQDLLLYNRPLTPEEIAHNYAIEKERFGIE